MPACDNILVLWDLKPVPLNDEAPSGGGRLKKKTGSAMPSQTKNRRGIRTKSPGGAQGFTNRTLATCVRHLNEELSIQGFHGCRKAMSSLFFFETSFSVFSAGADFSTTKDTPYPTKVLNRKKVEDEGTALPALGNIRSHLPRDTNEEAFYASIDSRHSPSHYDQASCAKDNISRGRNKPGSSTDPKVRSPIENIGESHGGSCRFHSVAEETHQRLDVRTGQKELPRADVESIDETCTSSPIRRPSVKGGA